MKEGLQQRTKRDKLEDLLKGEFSEGLMLAVRAALGVVASLSLSKRDNCLVLILEGTSGTGKSTVIRLCEPDRDENNPYLLRVDDFTPAAFVSHAANRSEGQLREIDLLPKLAHRVMLTKELAPLFRADDKELRKNFACLTSVLDGNGYQRSTGSQGSRGYAGDYAFNWIGATTPIPHRTHEIMAQLGNRLLSYEMESEEVTEDELMTFARQRTTDNTLPECRKQVNDFISAHFESHPLGSVDPDSILIDEEQLRCIIRYAQLVCAGRVEVFPPRELEEKWTASPSEGPQRVVLLLLMLAKGLALSAGRSRVTDEDLRTIRHVAFSSVPLQRRRLLTVLAHEDSLNSAQVERQLGVSRPTALNRMQELAATSIATFTEGDSAKSVNARIELAEQWRWLTSPPLKESGV